MTASVQYETGRRGLVWALLAAVGLSLMLPAAASRAAVPLMGVDVIVRELPGWGDEPERAVESLGGRVGRQIGIIDGFSAQLPIAAVARLARHVGIQSVTPNAPLQLNAYAGFDPKTDLGSMRWVAGEVTGAGEYWNSGYTGAGVDVALIDSGVLPVDGLTRAGKVVRGPDLSLESQDPNVAHLDTYGHGTHMAGIIAGRDDAANDKPKKGETNYFLGMAPDARIVSVKVADATGATDVSQVLAAIDWVVANRNRNGMNIRVLNLSFGTDGVQDYRFDPLTYAAEVAWRAGIVVVVAGGNAGFGSTKLNNPAYDPYVIAVGAADGGRTYDVVDDVVADFSSRGDDVRRPDLVAPGKSIVSLRAPGSYADAHNPSAQVGSRMFRGSGTSQAAAVVSGAAALIVSQRPSITPDEVKALLTTTAQRLPIADPKAQGNGMIDLKRARDTATPTAVQTWEPATGVGSLDLARGSAKLVHNGVTLDGERDIFGATFDGATWAPASGAGMAWSDGTWNGSTWSGSTWSGSTWSGSTWSGSTWSGSTWSGSTWSGSTWSGSTWSGSTWSGSTWSGSTWSGSTWSGSTWSGSTWSGSTWSSGGWV